MADVGPFKPEVQVDIQAEIAKIKAAPDAATKLALLVTLLEQKL